MKIKWYFASHMNLESEHILKYQGKKKGKKVGFTIRTPYNNGKPGIGKVSYYIGGGAKGTFETEEMLITALKEKK